MVGRIEGPGPHRDGHEIAAQDVAEVVQAGLPVVLEAFPDLIFADVEARDRGAESAREGALGAADTTADIQHLHVRLQAEGFAQKVLMAGEGFLKRRTFLPRGEVND